MYEGVGADHEIGEDMLPAGDLRAALLAMHLHGRAAHRAAKRRLPGCEVAVPCLSSEVEDGLSRWLDADLQPVDESVDPAVI